jgi:transglutaminase-like putative cysteine protease
MTIRVALSHQTTYRFDRLVGLSAHEVRLRPAPHCRTPIPAYSIQISTPKHFLNWQQDPYGNYIARYTFPDKLKTLTFTVDLIAEMTVINPFDFFVESYAEHYPFQYQKGLAKELAPFLEAETPGPQLAAWLARFRKEGIKPPSRLDRGVSARRRLDRA